MSPEILESDANSRISRTASPLQLDFHIIGAYWFPAVPRNRGRGLSISVSGTLVGLDVLCCPGSP